MEWWKLMQPSWQRNEANLPLFRDVPDGETWQTLRKGGTAGIYLIVTSLSWWIKAQHIERDVRVWSAVDNLSWVLQQMTGVLPFQFHPQRSDPMREMTKARTHTGRGAIFLSFHHECDLSISIHFNSHRQSE